MFTLYLHRCLILISAVLFFSCGGSKIQVKGTNFENEVALQQNLVFTFNNDLVTDSLLGKWDTTAYVQFQPQVRGKFKWTAVNELTFSPDLGFQASTDYQATLTDELEKLPNKEKRSVDTKEPLAFHTPYLALINSDIVWTKNANGTIEALFNLNFNYKVNPTQVTNLLKMTVDGKPVTFSTNTSMLSEVVQVVVPQKSGVKFDDKTAELTIAAGLKCGESKYISKEPMTLKVEIPSKLNFQVTQAVAEYEGEKGFIHVYTNQTVESSTLASAITLRPDMKYTVEAQDYGFVIKGDFKPGTYDLSISQELRGIFGGALKQAYDQTLVFGEMQPHISFLSQKAIYLSSKGSKNIGVKIINVPTVRVMVYKVYENNMLAFFRNNGFIQNYSSEYEGDYGYDEYGEGTYNEPNIYLEGNNQFGDVVLDREYDSKQLKKVGEASLLELDFEKLNEFKGIYVVKVASTEDQYVQSTKLVSISDIGFIVKETENDIVVFTNSILSAQSMGGVKINLVSTNNQQVYSGETNSDGVASFPDIRKKAPGFQVQMITARDGEDFNYLLFDQTKTETSRYEVGGSRDNPSGYQAFIYGDRDIYRPGETMYINTIIRDGAWKTVGALPVKLKVLLPNGKEFTTIKGTLSEQSAFATSVALPTSTVTGTYNVELYTSNDVLLNSKRISVEEFIPDRIKVNVTVNKPFAKAGESFAVNATALNLFGPPAANRNYEVNFTLQKAYFEAKGYADYNFYINGSEKTKFEGEVRQGKTDAEGSLSESFDIPENYRNMGLLEGSAFTTVFDETGRPVNRVNRFDVVTQDVFYGIRNFSSYVDTRSVLTIPLVALNKDGKSLQNATARVQIVKYNWQTVLEKDEYDSYKYVSQKREQVMDDRTVRFNGGVTNFNFTPTISGSYEIRVMKPGVESFVSQDFYAYGYGYTQNTAFEVDKEGQVTIEMDKPTYEVGDEAKVLLKTPFAGRVLITVERNKVFDHFYVDTDKKSASVTIPIKEAYLPNAYVTATLIKPLDDGAMPLTVGHGFAPFGVEKKENRLPLTIEAPAQSRSKTKQTITVKSKPESDIEVTVAIVDEGILQLKNYVTPDPHGYFFQKRALEVNSYDLYPRLFAELSGKKSSTGGDGYDLQKRVNPLTNKRVKLVAFWSGTLKTNGDGEAQYTIDIPQFSGDLRIMAVAYKNDAFGSANANMKVADPVVISTAMPRFLSPNDELQVPVTLTNTTNQSANATARLKVSGALQLGGESEQTVTIPANREAQVTFALTAKQAVGLGQVSVEVSAMGSVFTETIDITVRPITSLQKKSGSGVINAGKAQTVSLATDFIPATSSAKMIISKSPLVQFADNLDYLVRYPYGCVEQTVSAAFPQLYFADLSKSLLQARPAKNTAAMLNASANYNVQEAIYKLQSMQLYNGALSYWPEGGYESWWGTVYAAHFMVEARKAGYDVNNKVVDRMLGYLQQQVKKKQTEEYFYYENAAQAQGSGARTYRKVRNIAPKEVFYSLYILAVGGKQDVATMNYYKANRNLLALDCKYLLACTYSLLGDRGSFQAILPKGFQGEVAQRAFGGSFYSYIRDEAIILNSLVEVDPKNPQVPMLARHLSEQLRGGGFYSTQESAFSLLALGKIARQANQSGDVTAEVKAGGASVGQFTGADLVLKQNIVGKNVSISPSGSGNLYYFWQAEGLSNSNEVKEEDNFLQVRKTFFDRFGRAVSANSFKQNDLIVVKITLSTTDGSQVENVVVTDMLPAGFEIENPRISTFPEMTWASENAATPQYMDIRDDRINLFTTADGRGQTFYYVVRAVSKGKFVMGPVSADAMYNGEYHSQSGSGAIQVGEAGGALGMD